MEGGGAGGGLELLPMTIRTLEIAPAPGAAASGCSDSGGGAIAGSLNPSSGIAIAPAGPGGSSLTGGARAGSEREAQQRRAGSQFSYRTVVWWGPAGSNSNAAGGLTGAASRLTLLDRTWGTHVFYS